MILIAVMAATLWGIGAAMGAPKQARLIMIGILMLAVLAEHKTAVLSRAQLLELVWGYDFAADTNVVDVFIGYLRRKLAANGAPRLLHTVRGVGFVLRQQ